MSEESGKSVSVGSETIDDGRRNLFGLLSVLGIGAAAACSPQERGGTGSTVQAATGASIKWTDNLIADLLANTDVQIGADVVIARGYAAAGDAGGGVFTWANDTTTTHNGGTVIVPTAMQSGGGTTRTGCWKRVDDGPVNVVWFGAKGDGTTNDTSAIQSALDFAGVLHSTTRIPATVFVPEGVYLVSKASAGSYCLSMPSGVKLYGPGQIKLANGQTLQVRVIRVEDVRDVTIEGLTIDGNSANQSSEPTDPKKHAFFVRGSQNVLIRRVKVINVDGDAFYFGKSNASSVAYAKHCRVEDFWVDGTRRSVVTVTAGASHITVSRGYGVNWSGNQSPAINIESDTDRTTGCTFEDLYIDDPAPETTHVCYAVNLGQGDNTLIRRCWFKGCIFVNRSNDVTITDCTIDHPGNPAVNGGSGIQARYICDRLKIVRNKITVQGSVDLSRFHVACIYVLHTNSDTPSDLVIEGNHLFPSDGNYGIRVNSLLGETAIKGNYIDGAGVGGGIVALTESSLPFGGLIVANNVVKNVLMGSTIGSLYIINMNSGSGYFQRIDIVGNHFIDDQTTPTSPRVMRFASPNLGQVALGNILIANNTWTSSLADDSGLSWWRTGGNYDGTANTSGEFEGTGLPAIAAKAGSIYRRRDGGTGTSFYVKESSSGSSGWVAK